MPLLQRLVILSLITLLFTVASSAQESWSQLTSSTRADLVAVYFTSATKGWIAGDAGFLASTNDGGRTWNKYPLKATEDINEIYFRNEENGYLVAGRKLFITADGGNSWRETVIFRQGDVRNGTPEFLSIRFADKRRGLVVGSVLNRNGDVIDSLVMRTIDGGETWQRLIVPSKAELFHLDFDGTSRAWIVGDGGVILATTDGGDTWRLQNANTTNALYNVDFRDDDEGYAVGSKGTILRTENGGETWTRVITPFKDTFMRVDFADDKNGWIVGYGGTVLRSSDKGKSWMRQQSSTTNHLYGLFMMKRNGFAVGAKGSLIAYRK